MFFSFILQFCANFESFDIQELLHRGVLTLSIYICVCVCVCVGVGVGVGVCRCGCVVSKPSVHQHYYFIMVMLCFYPFVKSGTGWLKDFLESVTIPSSPVGVSVLLSTGPLSVCLS